MRTASIFLTIVVSAPSVWADGMLDPDFGDGGRVTTSFGRTTLDWGTGLAIQTDGRIVAAGTAYRGPGGTNTYMAIARYLPSGALDTSFDGDGLRLVDFEDPNGVGANEVLLQPDGKLVLVGRLGISGPPRHALARLNPDGSLDSSFGIGGKVVTPVANAFTAGAAAVLQPDGRIVVLGTTGTLGTETVTVARYNSDGSLDGSFGTGGQVAVPQAAGLGGRALALQPDGKVLVAGDAVSPPAVEDFGLIRLLPGGAIDTSFDGDGIVRSDFGGIERGRAVGILADGRILISGYASSTGLALVRYEANGAVDTTFGRGGLASTHSGVYEVADALVQQPDGKLLVAGWRDAEFVLARFGPDGSLDTSFGTGGSLTTDFGGLDSAHALAITGTDRVLALGTTYDGVAQNQYFALARYTASTPVEVMSFSVE